MRQGECEHRLSVIAVMVVCRAVQAGVDGVVILIRFTRFQIDFSNHSVRVFSENHVL